MLVLEEREGDVPVHFCDATVYAKEDFLVLMLACCGAFVVARELGGMPC